jgi:hypothetical protein
MASVAAFVALYLVATLLYPGGSRISPTSAGFSWVHNYWCDLLGETTYGGRANPAAPVARSAMTILCAGLAALWLAAPRLLPAEWIVASWVVRMAGVGCALVIPWVGLGLHDAAVRVAGALGGIAFVTTLVGLPRRGVLRRLGAMVLGLVAVNYFIWETGLGHDALAAIQKLAFVGFLGWVVLAALKLRELR